MVDAFEKMFNAPENVCEALSSNATLADSAASAIESAGNVSVPVVRVKPFEAVRSPKNVPVPEVEKAPVDVVVALPFTHKAFETDSWVVDALPSVVNPVTFSVDVAVIAPPKKPVPLV